MFEKYAGKRNVTMKLEVIQKAALSKTAGLLRKVFAFYGLNNNNNNTKSFICMTIKELQYCKSY